MSKILNEYDFLQTISIDLAEYYKKSVDQFELGFHADALVNLRHALCVIVTEIYGALELPSTVSASDLSRKIEELKDSGKVLFYMVGLMHKIRQSVNKAAHPDEYKTEDFQSLYTTVKKDFFALTEAVVSKVYKRTVPEYTFSFQSEFSNLNISERALFENHSDSMYYVAKRLLQNAKEILITSRRGYVDQHTLVEHDSGEQVKYYHNEDSSKNVAIAFEMLKKCDFDNTDARYELGYLMLNDGHWLRPYTVPSEVKSDALMNLRQAAYREHVDAMCLLGEIYLKGLHEQDVDAEYGLELLKESAELGSSKANLVLAEHYQNTGDKVKANDHYKKSAELGSPKAKLIVASKAWNKELSLNADETILEYINDALSSGIEKAHFLKALYLTKHAAGKFSQEAANEYKSFINSVFDATSAEKLLCAQYFILHKFELELAHQIIMYTAIDTQNNEEKQVKEVFSYLYSLIKFGSSETGLIYRFHPDHLLSIKELVAKLNQLKIADALLSRPKEVNIPKNFPRNDLCPCGSNRKYKVCHYLK